MTNEEAILMLERIMYDEDNHGIEWATGAKKAFDMAIEALKKQDVPDKNVGDTISRQALCEYALNQKDKSVTPNDIMRFPSVQPEITDLQFLQPESEYVFYDSDHGFCINTQDVLDCLRKELRNG